MPVFEIVPTEDKERLARAVSSAFAESDRYILPGRQACFVRYAGSAKELAILLDIEGRQESEGRPCPAVISVVTTFGGFAPTSLWEWLRANL